MAGWRVGVDRDEALKRAVEGWVEDEWRRL
jgi:hypothetical protein